MEKIKKNYSTSRTNKKILQIHDKRKTICEVIESNFGFLGTKGRLLKALMEEKKYEKGYKSILQ